MSTVPEPVNINPFDEPTTFRNFKMIVEHRNFFVSPHFLAERSSFFERLCFGDFAEAIAYEAVLTQVSAVEFHVFLCVLGADAKKEPMDVEHTQVSGLLKLADAWDVPLLLVICKTYLFGFYQNQAVTKEEALEVLVAVCKAKMDNACHRSAIQKLVPFSRYELMEMKAHQKLPPLVSAMLFHRIGEKEGDYEKEERHKCSADKHEYECDVYKCHLPAKICSDCGLSVCNYHAEGACPQKRRLDFTVKMYYECSSYIDDDFIVYVEDYEEDE